MRRGDLTLDLRTTLPVTVLGLVVLAIIVVELCGREDQGPLALATPLPRTPASAETAASPSPGASVTPGPSPTAEASATPREAEAGAEERDGTRQSHLATIADALRQYRQENGEFPTTSDAVQTLCVFEDADAGCQLREVIDEIPADPLGLSTDNGYWYQSTGARFTVFAKRESERFPECPEHPDFLEDVDSLLCVSGP